ncbi:MAG: hypothetical protein RLZZ453_328 [Chlamydiota bacterium]|jgi:hypothetical protein
MKEKNWDKKKEHHKEQQWPQKPQHPSPGGQPGCNEQHKKPHGHGGCGC